MTFDINQFELYFFRYFWYKIYLYEKILPAIALLTTLSLSTRAQVNIGYGIEAGFGGLITINIYEPPSYVNSTLKNADLFGGGFVEFAFGEHFSEQDGVYIFNKGAERYDITYLGIPLLSEWQFDEGHGFLVYAGPCLDFAVGTSKDVIIGKPEVNNYKLGVHAIDLGARAGIGYRFRNGLFFKAGYELGLSNMASTKINGEKISDRGLTLSLGFIFHTRSRHKFY